MSEFIYLGSPEIDLNTIGYLEITDIKNLLNSLDLFDDDYSISLILKDSERRDQHYREQLAVWFIKNMTNPTKYTNYLFNIEPKINISKLLNIAIMFNKIDLVKYLIEEGADISFNQYNSLKLASILNNIEILTILLENIDKVNINDEQNLERISKKIHFIALLNGNVELVRLTISLLTTEFIDQQQLYNETFILASKYGHLDILKSLIQTTRENDTYYEEEILYNSVQEAIREGHLEIVEYLVARDPNIINYIFGHRRSLPPFLIASQGGHLGIVKFLHEQGADINQEYWKEGVKYTALSVAADHDNLNVVKYLIEQGINTNTINEVLDKSIRYNQPYITDITKYLIQTNPTDFLYDVLIISLENNPKTFQYLFNKYSSILSEEELLELLTTSIQYGNLDTTKTIIENGGLEINLLNDEMIKLALDRALNYQDSDILKYLIEIGT